MSGSLLLLPYAARSVGRFLRLFRFHSRGGQNHTTYRTIHTDQNGSSDDADTDAHRNNPGWNFRPLDRWGLRHHFHWIFRRIRSRLGRRLWPRVFITLPLVRPRFFLSRTGLNAFWRISPRVAVFVVIVVVVPVFTV